MSRFGFEPARRVRLVGTRSHASGGSADVVHGGASDDGFEYFRCWLISRGRVVYERVLNIPDDLAETSQPMSKASSNSRSSPTSRVRSGPAKPAGAWTSLGPSLAPFCPAAPSGVEISKALATLSQASVDVTPASLTANGSLHRWPRRWRGFVSETTLGPRANLAGGSVRRSNDPAVSLKKVCCQ